MSRSCNNGLSLIRSGMMLAFNQTQNASKTLTPCSAGIKTVSSHAALNCRAYSINSVGRYLSHVKPGIQVASTRSLLEKFPRGKVSSLGVRWSSSSSDDDTKTEVKGFFIQFPNPLEWIKDRVFTVFIRRFLDPTFNIDEFVFGAKQALSYLTRLMVMKDYETMKVVATDEVISKMKDLVSTWSDEQQQSIEILVTDISLASAHVSAVSSLPDSHLVSVDLFCVALRTYKQQPLLVQMKLRFSRCYEAEKEHDWRIHRILEFNVREILEKERDRYRK